MLDGHRPTVHIYFLLNIKLPSNVLWKLILLRHKKKKRPNNSTILLNIIVQVSNIRIHSYVGMYFNTILFSVHTILLCAIAVFD